MFCFNCGSEKIYNLEAVLICINCGMEHNSFEENSNDISTLMPQASLRLTLFTSNKIKNGRFIQTKHNIWNAIPYPETRSLNTYKIIFDRTEEYRKIITPPIIVKIVKLYNNFLNYEKSRGNKKKAIIAKCLQNILYEYDFIINNKELITIFEITNKNLSDGNKTINKLYVKHKHIRKKYIKIPICLLDYIPCLKYRFPILTDDDVKKIKKIAERISKHRISITNVPKSLITGIVKNYFSDNNIKIQNNIIEKAFDVSKSTLAKYTELIKLYKVDY